jgi:hypothetical protein
VTTTNSAAAIALIKQAIALLEKDAGEEAPVLTSGRVETVGKVAQLHLKVLEEKGTLTVSDSREIRRSLSPTLAKMRSTANYFGSKDSGAILYREVAHGTRVRGGQTVKLTKEGLRLAAAYRSAHPDA